MAGAPRLFAAVKGTAAAPAAADGGGGPILWPAPFSGPGAAASMAEAAGGVATAPAVANDEQGRHALAGAVWAEEVGVEPAMLGGDAHTPGSDTLEMTSDLMTLPGDTAASAAADDERDPSPPPPPAHGPAPLPPFPRREAVAARARATRGAAAAPAVVNDEQLRDAPDGNGRAEQAGAAPAALGGATHAAAADELETMRGLATLLWGVALGDVAAAAAAKRGGL